MDDTTAVPPIVHSTSRDAVEALNSLLRRAGMAAHCTWIPALQDIPDAIEQLNPELLICCSSAPDGVKRLGAMRNGKSGLVPMIALRDQVDEVRIADDGEVVAIRHRRPSRMRTRGCA